MKHACQQLEGEVNSPFVFRYAYDVRFRVQIVENTRRDEEH